MNKYIYLFVVQGHYAPRYGWEDLFESESRKEARQTIKEYRVADLFPKRIIQRRVKSI